MWETILGVAALTIGFTLGRLVRKRSQPSPLPNVRDNGPERGNEITTTAGTQWSREKFNFMAQIIVGISHELSTPLGNAHMAESVLQDLIATVEETQGCLDREDIDQPLTILSSALGNMINLVNRFKELKRLGELNQQQQVPFETDIGALVGNAAKKYTIPRNRVAVTVTNEEHVIAVPLGVETIIAELIDNSFCHSFQPLFTLNRVRDDTSIFTVLIDIRKNTSSGHIKVRYVTNGLPIHSSIKDSMFEPFVTSKRSQGRVGMGLFLVKGIMEHSMLGSIELVQGLEQSGISYEIQWPMGLS